ncbi:MAG: sugar ABC transporter substrate-binding protein [Actinobacteria bacterium]|nr:sugar ABC transporter substrate-binding protein [Actinomycetota bacterium]
MVVAVSCGGSDTTSGSVRLLVFGDPPELEAYRTLIQAFAEEEPEIDVELVEASDRDDLIARLSTSIAGGSPPDLFLMNYRFYGQFAARGVLEPLESYVEDSAAFALDDFYPQAVDAFRWDGQATCVPQNISSLVVYYNRDLFERFAVPVPTDDMAWSQFVYRAQQLTRDADGNLVRGADPDLPPQPNAAPAAIYGLGVEPTIIRFAPFIWSNRAELVDDERDPTRFTLDTPAAKSALEQFFQLRTLQGVVPPDVEVEAEDDETRFLNGRLAMLLESRRLVPALREAATFDWDVAALPRHQQPASILHSDAYCMTKASKQKDAAWRFVEYALGPDGAPVIAKTGRTVPSLRSVAESEAFLDPTQKPRHAKVFLDAIATIRTVPTVSTWPEIEDAAEPILENGMYRAQPIDEVAAAVDEATRPLFARAE